MKLQKQLLYFLCGVVAFSCTSNKNNPNPDRVSPIADFSANSTNITTGGTINFTDLSTENPTSWLWNFQGGTPSTSTVKNPTNIQYNSAGTYTVTLTATNADGNNTKTKTGYITVTVATPTLTTTAVSIITNTSINTGGNVINQGSSPVIARGVCWSNTPNPTVENDTIIKGSGTGSFTSSLMHLTANTTYYLRAFATNSNGTGYGNEISFKTSGNCGTVTDIDGNIYHTVTVGTQCWMVEDLKTTRYNDGTTIGSNSYSLPIPYGKLYTWDAVNSGKLAPTGWHVPTQTDWRTLIIYLDPSAASFSSSAGGNISNTAGGAMKDTTLWNNPNTGATNSSGFTSIPAGARFNTNLYGNGISSDYWSSSLYPADPAAGTYAWYFQLSNTTTSIFTNGMAVVNRAKSVRCVKN